MVELGGVMFGLLGKACQIASDECIATRRRNLSRMAFGIGKAPALMIQEACSIAVLKRRLQGGIGVSRSIIGFALLAESITQFYTLINVRPHRLPGLRQMGGFALHQQQEHRE